MEEFVGTKESAKKLYKKVRKNYRRWLYGNSIMSIFILICFAFFIRIYMEGGLSFDTIILSLGVCFIPIIASCISRAVAVSGGREVLMNRDSDKLVLYDDYFVMEYVPTLTETKDYALIRYVVYYSDIHKLESYHEKGFAKICCDYSIQKYQSENDLKPASIETRIGDAFIVYEYYNNFNKFMSKVCQRSKINIEKKSENH